LSLASETLVNKYKGVASATLKFLHKKATAADASKVLES